MFETNERGLACNGCLGLRCSALHGRGDANGLQALPGHWRPREPLSVVSILRGV
jgi:hypothetical protein